MPSSLRVALLTDSFHEANGVATLSRQMAHFARDRNVPFLAVYGGDQTRFTREQSFETLQLKRGPFSFPLDKGLYCDPFLTRHKSRVAGQLRSFNPDLVHITGPGDLGFLGLWVAHILKVPLVASWHTNLHEYASLRLQGLLSLLPRRCRDRLACAAEHQILRALMRFYRTARFVFAPNDSTVDLLHFRTGKPSFLLRHGVDLGRYSPALPSTPALPFCIGYVGRLTLEKNVRYFVELERELFSAGRQDFKFLLVGEGSQREWLKRHLTNAELPGILRGDDLAAAYRRMSVFVFPSRTDTFGLVLLEAMASGVPVIATPETGARVGIEDGRTGLLTENFPYSLIELMQNHDLRARMSLAARRFVEPKSWCGVFQELYESYEEGLRIVSSGPALRTSVTLRNRN